MTPYAILELGNVRNTGEAKLLVRRSFALFSAHHRKRQEEGRHGVHRLVLVFRLVRIATCTA